MRSELTFLGDAEDAGKFGASLPEEDQKPKANVASMESDVNGFHLSTKDTFAAASGAADRRIAVVGLDDSEQRQQRAFCHTLPPEFLTSWNQGYTTIGTKVARLLQEIKTMMRKDKTNKAMAIPVMACQKEV